MSETRHAAEYVVDVCDLAEHEIDEIRDLIAAAISQWDPTITVNPRE